MLAFLDLKQELTAISKKNAVIIAAVELRRRIVDTYILCIIVRKFCLEQEPCPVVLLLIEKNMKINLHYTIFSFDPTFHLLIKYNAKHLLYAKKVAEERQKFSAEQRVLICNN